MFLILGFHCDDQCWQAGDLQQTVLDESPVFTTPSDEKHPLDYFRHYFNDEILEVIVHETNLCTAQEKNKPLAVTKEEILAFLAYLFTWVYANIQPLSITGLSLQEFHKWPM